VRTRRIGSQGILVKVFRVATPESGLTGQSHEEKAKVERA
jgi:hypothetical protein